MHGIGDGSSGNRHYNRHSTEKHKTLADDLWSSTRAFTVGLTGFEPATPCPPDKCATKLRYSPYRGTNAPYVEQDSIEVR